MIYDNGMKAFPTGLPQQPIFYPVLDLEYARQTASDWNVKNGQFAGYVTEFKVEDEYIGQFEKHNVGGSQHQEFWIPAEDLEEFNKHITGHIKVLEAHFGDAFEGFVPDKFGLQGKNAVAQFTLLANIYIYKRMDFYLEIRRNHKAVFLNYPFWLKHEFKNPGLKEKVLKAIKEAWSTAFPQIPLPVPPAVAEDALLEKPVEAPAPARPLDDAVQKDSTPVEGTDLYSMDDPFQDDDFPAEETDSRDVVQPAQEDHTHAKKTNSTPPMTPDEEDTTLMEQSDSSPAQSRAQQEIKSLEQRISPSLATPARQSPTPVKPMDSGSLVRPVQERIMPAKPEDAGAHFLQGVQSGLSGKYHEAIDGLSRAVRADPRNAVAHTSLGVAFHRLGEDDRALSCYEAALKIDPQNAEAHYFQANILYGHRKAREAIAEYTTAIGLKPELIEAHQAPAPQDRLTDYTPSPAEMHRIAKPAHRILDLNKSLETNPRQANLFKERAAEYHRLGNYQQAIADYSAALAVQSDDADALHLRGLAYEQIGQLGSALEDYQQAITVNPQLADLYINRGITFGSMGHFRQSIASLTEAIRLAPKNPNAYFNRGMSYFQQGDLESAMDDFSKVIRLSPEDEEAYYWRGTSLEQAGRQQDAIADYRRFLAISQNSQARDEIEQRLSQWNVRTQTSAGQPDTIPDEGQKTDQVLSEKPDQVLDLHDLIAALGERALRSTWFGSGVECYGEKAEELYAFTDHDKAMAGHDLLEITSGIQQTIHGDFQAFDPGTASPWIFIRAWEGSGFYIETNDPRSRERLSAHFQAVEEVQGAAPPYTGLFIHI